MTDEPNLLGDYLRARRELVTPEDVGIPVSTRRKVVGLRREEVAMLAGISAEYYLRLEQGRDRRPSHQVLEAIARVLRLDDESHLMMLADEADPGRRRKRGRPRRQSISPSIERLVQALPLPAFVEGRYLDVLAANALATAMSPRLEPGRNRLRDVFLDPGEQALFRRAERAAGVLVAGFRQSVGTDVDDPRVVELVGELSILSPRFRELWARHDVAGRSGGSVVLDHPLVGELALDRDKFPVQDTGGFLVVYQPRPDTDAAEKLALIAATSAPHPVPVHGQPEAEGRRSGRS